MTFTIYDADLAPGTAEEDVSDTTLSFLVTDVVPVDKLAVLCVVWDNVSTANADDTALLSVTDTLGNTWTRAAEAQYSAGGALDGVLAGIFYSVITTQLEVTTTINIVSTANGTGKAAMMGAFNRDTSKTIAVAGKGYQRIAASTSYTVTVSGLPSEEHLWIGWNAAELALGNLNGSDTAWSNFTQGGSVEAGGANVSSRCGYKIASSTSEQYDRAALTSADRCTVVAAFNELAAGGTVTLDPFGMSGFFGG